MWAKSRAFNVFASSTLAVAATLRQLVALSVRCCVEDCFNCVVVCGVVELVGAVVTTLAGSGTFSFADGSGSNAAFRQPAAVAVDASGNVFVCDYTNQRIRKVTASGGMWSFQSCNACSLF